MYSILHLSDLHRSAAEPISNESLIAALLADNDRFPMETPPIRQPDAMVVSGDMVAGVRLGDSNFESVLKGQYEVAHEFLAELTDRLLDGDRSRVVMVPGNHDCCWNTAFGAMVTVPDEEEIDDLIGELESWSTDLRWSWDKRKLYRVSDIEAYSRRLESYWDFVEGFYGSDTRQFPLQRNKGYNLYELDKGRILIAGFESVQGNDCFSYKGGIDPTAIANAALEIRDEGARYSLRIAVWHHGLHSEPSYRSDYVSMNSIYDLIGHRFQLGLHGHQHYAEIGSHYVRVPNDLEMAVVSAGSLCAGSRELPWGINRQYNVVVVSDDYSEIEVHVREMTRGNHFVASSGASGIASGMVRMRLAQSTVSDGVEADMDQDRNNTLILEAERELRSGRPEAALSLLEAADRKEVAYARSLAVEAAEKLEQWEKVATLLERPVNAGERVKLVEALVQLGRTEEAMEAVGRPDGPALARHVRRELEQRIARLRAIQGK
ncbi:MAG: metallophosphoesterase [Gammaproteobacteria bacterium]|nr:metallophosphoesterase [Gammaproteobacteria bacterium]